jgi:hypothetical protein
MYYFKIKPTQYGHLTLSFWQGAYSALWFIDVKLTPEKFLDVNDARTHLTWLCNCKIAAVV